MFTSQIQNSLFYVGIWPRAGYLISLYLWEKGISIFTLYGCCKIKCEHKCTITAHFSFLLIAQTLRHIEQCFANGWYLTNIGSTELIRAECSSCHFLSLPPAFLFTSFNNQRLDFCLSGHSIVVASLQGFVKHADQLLPHLTLPETKLKVLKCCIGPYNSPYVPSWITSYSATLSSVFLYTISEEFTHLLCT